MILEESISDDGAFEVADSTQFPRPSTSLPASGVSSRRRALWLLPFLICGRPATSQQAASAPTSSAAVLRSPFRITGTVIDSLTKSPVPGAELTIAHMGTRRANGRAIGRADQQTAGQTDTAVADAAGHFAIEVPSAGGWSVTAAAHGYHSQAFEEHEGYSTAIILTEANPSYDLTFPLPPASVIEGYVLDEAGEPVRNGQLTVSLIPPVTPEDLHPRRQVRGNQHTDDRGYYKFSGLLAGNYEVCLQAQPWYASNGASRFGRSIGNGSGIVALAGSIGANGADSSTPDPLDVVYPTLWYPGVADFSAAAPLALHPGEVREADFRLSPMPGFHLRIAAAAPPADDARGRAIQSSAYLSQVLPDGTETGIPAAARPDSQGNMDFSGLAPGTYIIHRQGELVGASGAATTIQISPNSARTVNSSQASAGTIVTVKIDPAADIPSLQVSFKDLDTGRISLLQNPPNFGSRDQHMRFDAPDRLAAGVKDAPRADRSISLQPGRYQISLSGINDLHLTSIEATGATATGRTVSISGGSPSLMLHVAGGHTNLTGVVRSHGNPVAGAMVLLVPATLGNPIGFDIIRRDQSNTDGSFDILDVLPGAYILVAIDHGWDVNWRDPATLRGFLMHGRPLDLTAPGERKEVVEAQSP